MPTEATLDADGPIEVTDARTLFPSPAIQHRSCASIVRLESGRLLLAFRLASGPERRNDGAVMVTRSDDGGITWEPPLPIFASPGSDCLPMGGLVRFHDGLIRLIVGQLRIDPRLGGDEPFSEWRIWGSDSFDGGTSWSALGPEIRLFPCWTELYGASNPHALADGRYLLACMGTVGRDEGWHAGVVITDAHGAVSGKPVIVAAAPGRNFSDIDVARLPDGGLLAVVREHVSRQSYCTRSADEGRTWGPIRPTGFSGANIKLLRLRSGDVLCTYRDEDPERRGVSCSVTRDRGDSWTGVGQLYSAPQDTRHQPGLLCGYPDMVYTAKDEIVCVLHTYPDGEGRIDLRLLRLRDRT